MDEKLKPRRKWRVNPKEVVKWLMEKEERNAQSLSYHIVNDMTEEDAEGECAKSNLALAIFERALDWRIGLAVIRLIDRCMAQKKMPKPFDLVYTRDDKLYAQFDSGKIIPLEV
jgi:hypothetical protein